MWASIYPNLVGHVTVADGMMSALTFTHLQE